MTDKLTPERRSENMRRIRSTSTKPEMAVRKLIYSMGYRYRVHRRDLPGKPDIVFGPRRKIIFVHGCFWHQHPISGCLDSRRPKSNTAYWESKLRRNIERDTAAQANLESAGWQVLVVWECETRDLAALTEKLRRFLL